MYQYEKSRKAQLHEKSFSWFEGIGGVQDVRWTSVLHGPEWNGDLHQQAKKAFCTYKCTACQLAIFMLRELNFRQELSTKGC